MSDEVILIHVFLGHPRIYHILDFWRCLNSFAKYVKYVCAQLNISLGMSYSKLLNAFAIKIAYIRLYFWDNLYIEVKKQPGINKAARWHTIYGKGDQISLGKHNMKRFNGFNIPPPYLEGCGNYLADLYDRTVAGLTSRGLFAVGGLRVAVIWNGNKTCSSHFYSGFLWGYIQQRFLV